MSNGFNINNNCILFPIILSRPLRIEGMEVELRRLREREAEDAKTLETMVHHVEANLKRTTVTIQTILTDNRPLSIEL